MIQSSLEQFTIYFEGFAAGNVQTTLYFSKFLKTDFILASIQIFHRSPDKQILSVKLKLFSVQLVYRCDFDAQKNRLIETVWFFSVPTTYVLVEK